MPSKRQHHKPNSTSKARVEKAAARNRVPVDMMRNVPGRTTAEKKSAAADMRRHGFRVAAGRVIVDGPRDRKRKPIKGAKVEVMRGGVVKTSVENRRDFIIGFTKKERMLFAAFPDAFLENKLLELEIKYPLLRHRRNRQVRLQWGAYQATKDFSPSYFTSRYFATVAPEARRREGKKAKPRADKLTGLHIVVHVPAKKKKSAGKKRK